MTKAVIRCEVCNEVILEGKQLYYKGKDDGITGEYFTGCGCCDRCGRYLCETCGDFVYSVCTECRAEAAALGDRVTEPERVRVMA